MTDLSPAAQAIAKAAWAAFWSNEAMAPNDAEMIAAATLRAVANQCKIKWNYHPDYPETESVIIVSELLTIATELENQP